MSTPVAVKQDAKRQLAAIVGGQPGPNGTRTATHEYRLGCAWDRDTLLVNLIVDVPGIGIPFEAKSFDDAFERALAIGEDLADVAGHRSDGVLVSLTAFGSLAEIGVDAD